MIETIGNLNGQIAMTVSNTEFKEGINMPTEEITSNMEQLDLLEEIADEKAYNITMGQILNSLIDKTPDVWVYSFSFIIAPSWFVRTTVIFNHQHHKNCNCKYSVMKCFIFK